MVLNLAIYLVFIVFLSGCTSNPQELLYNQKPAFYGYIFGDVDGDSSTIEYAADVYVTPASCQKVVTALLSYKTLGSDYCYQTKLLAHKPNGKIQDIIIEFSGDPTLSSNDLIELLKPLRGRHIPGKIILDLSAFQTSSHSPNLMIADLGTRYAQPVSSFILDQNLINVTVTPRTLYQHATIKNDAGYATDPETMTTLEKSEVGLACDGDELKATGTINIASKPLEFKISPKVIDGYILNKIKQILKISKITGQVVIINNPRQPNASLEVLGTHRSTNLGKIIPPALQKSDNLVFDSLYLTIIHQADFANIKKWEDGDKVIKSLIKQHFDLPMEKALFVDGSGLSRYNRIQPRQLFKLLKKGYMVKEFVNALPFPGQVNSRLEKRSGLPTGIKAKTGVMSGIDGLCGYYISDSSAVAFMIIANSFAPTISETNAVLDNFISNYLG